MPYVLTFTSAAEKDARRLDRKVLDRVRPHILALADVPRPHGCLKLAGSEDLYRIRVGDYRVIYQIDDASTTVTITIIAHRRESYRGL